METKEKELTIEDVKDVMDLSYTLNYVDYRDSLDEYPKEIQESIQNQNWESIDGILEEWNMFEQTWESIDQIFKDLANEISNEFDVDENEVESFIEDHKEELEEEIYNRDDSSVLEDLIRHTDNPVCFYDTGIDLSACYDKEDFKENFRLIKKTLKVKGKAYDRHINSLLVNASYGGSLVIYFRGVIVELMKLGEYNTITFKNPMIAITDRWNGSGDNEDFENHEFSLPLDPKNIYLDKALHYNYTYEVCGMSDSWCNCTDVLFSKKVTRGKSNVK